MSLNFFLAVAMLLLVNFVNCAPIPGQIIKYKVADKYFNDPDRKYGHVPIIDLLNQVHLQGIDHPDVSLIANTDIQIEDSHVPVEEDGVLNVLKPGNVELEDTSNSLRSDNSVIKKVHYVFH